MAPRKKKIEEIYKEMDEITHVLSRPGMYVGSIKDETRQMFIYDSDESMMTMKDVNYAPAMLKVFDEILSNSCDEYRRDTNLGLTKIEVTAKYDGTITIKDNGGMPIIMHKDAKCYIPEFVFGRLRTSSNYNDDEDRQLIGTNGVGSVLSNIFSSSFTVDSADGKNSFHRSWSENMRKLNDDLVVKKCNDHYTQTTFKIDFSKFDVDYNELPDDFVAVLEKRCIDAAAANPKLKVSFKYIDKNKKELFNKTWMFNKFEQYIELYNDFIDTSAKLSFENELVRAWIFPGSNINVGFVDGAECSRGTHMNAIRLRINKTVQDLFEKKKMPVTLHNVDTKYSLFCECTVSNPAYDSQTKECLTTPIDKFSKDEKIKFEVPEQFLNKVEKSEIIDIMKDWYSQKQSAEEQAKIRKMNRESGKLLRNDKFINCTSKKEHEKQLWIFEGDSAASGFRAGRNSMTQAGYLMRGVPLNILGLKASEIMKNQVFNDIIKILGLKFGEYNKKSDLKFGKIVISTDMDYDGHKIAALLIVFFNLFPELFEQKVICRIISPIIIATKGKQTKKYFSLEQYKKDEKKLTNGWTIKYVKGLGGLNAKTEYREMMASNNFQYFTKDDLADMMLNKWFGKGIASVRKDMLKEDVEAK